MECNKDMGSTPVTVKQLLYLPKGTPAVLELLATNREVKRPLEQELKEKRNQSDGE